MAFVSRITAAGGYAFESASPRTAAAEFYVFTPSPGGEALIRFEGGALLINIAHEEDGSYLIFQDGINDLRVELPFTEEQDDGSAWAIVKLRRIDDNLCITVDKTDLAPVPLVHVNYGGVVHVGEFSMAKMFDIRVLDKDIPKSASDYYYDDIYQNQGRSLLPLR